MKRLSPLPRVSRHPEALKAVIRRKRERHQNVAREQRELAIAVCQQIRREMRQA